MVEILEKKEEPLLSRTKIIAEMDFEGATPNNSNVKNRLTNALKSKGDLTIIRKISSMYGKNVIKIEAYEYKSKENMDKIEEEHTIKKNFPPKKEEEPKAEAPKAEEPKAEEVKAEEPKVEEKKEEPKAEEKSE